MCWRGVTNFELGEPLSNIAFNAGGGGGGGGGGIRYQVPDFTLVGGSFFLPKTQLVHGTNWWVYCPFSRKTVSTWY